MNKSKGCLAILFDRIGPYHFTRLRAIGQLVPTVAIETYGMDDIYAWDLVGGADSFKRVTLFASRDAQMKSDVTLSHRVHSVLDECRPAAVAIPGWADHAALSAMQWCVQRRIPAIMMSDSTEWDQKRVLWKEWIKGRLVRLASSSLVAGAPHADYIKKLGLASDRVFAGYDVVDNDYFKSGAEEARRQAVGLREKYALPQDYFLASARFVEKKNLIRLIQAYAGYRARATKTEQSDPAKKIWNLVLLGDGPLREDIRAQIAALNLNEYVLLHGFRQYQELPVFYGLARAFIHASTIEQWGLVVNEAMASGLPVLVSNRCGCATDLVQENKTGFSFDPFNIDQMSDVMFRCSADPVKLSEMGQAAQNLISNWGCGRFTDGLVQAMETAIQSPLPKASALDPILLKFLLRRNAG
jgi:1,2-diacylglycerol 3-alpha-glucosyltransferase